MPSIYSSGLPILFSYSLEDGRFPGLLNSEKPRNAAGSSAYDFLEKGEGGQGVADGSHNRLDGARDHDHLDTPYPGRDELGARGFAARILGNYMRDPIFADE